MSPDSIFRAVSGLSASDSSSAFSASNAWSRCYKTSGRKFRQFFKINFSSEKYLQGRKTEIWPSESKNFAHIRLINIELKLGDDF
jgi:hypothetical protein